MHNCIYNNTCCRLTCDYSCSLFSEIEHWMNRCDISIDNPVVTSDVSEIQFAASAIESAFQDNSIQSSYMHLYAFKSKREKYDADLISYAAILEYCRNSGLYQGVYKLSFSDYLSDMKNSWNNRNDADILEKKDIWIRSSKFLIIYNLGLIRFGDFESQTLLKLFQSRYDTNKCTIVILEDSKYCLPGKSDSLFYLKLKNEISSRGVKL